MHFQSDPQHPAENAVDERYFVTSQPGARPLLDPSDFSVATRPIGATGAGSAVVVLRAPTPTRSHVPRHARPRHNPQPLTYRYSAPVLLGPPSPLCMSPAAAMVFSGLLAFDLALSPDPHGLHPLSRQCDDILPRAISSLPRLP